MYKKKRAKALVNSSTIGAMTETVKNSNSASSKNTPKKEYAIVFPIMEIPVATNAPQKKQAKSSKKGSGSCLSNHQINTNDGSIVVLDKMKHKINAKGADKI